MTETVQREYYSPKEIAQKVGIHLITVRRLYMGGRIPYRKIGRGVRILKKDWDAYDKANTIA